MRLLLEPGQYFHVSFSNCVTKCLDFYRCSESGLELIINNYINSTCSVLEKGGFVSML